MVRWIPFAAACAVFLACADFFVKLASSRISSSLGALIYGGTTFLTALVWVGYQRAAGQQFYITPLGLGYAVAVGLAFSGVTFLLYVTFAQVSVSIGSPVIRITGIVLASLLGIVLLREALTWRYVLGVILALTGVALIILR